MKSIEFAGSSLRDIRSFPSRPRREAGHQLDRVQRGMEPADWKPMPIIGQGVREIRIQSGGQFRVLLVANYRGRVLVLHAFEKKSQKTPKSEINRARKVLNVIVNSER